MAPEPPARSLIVAGRWNLFRTFGLCEISRARMRVLFVHNTLNDSKSVSGVLRHYAWLANEFNARGHRADFLVARAGFPQLRDLAPSAHLVSSDNIFNATKYLSKTWTYFPPYFWRLATAHFTRLPAQYDIVYASAQLIVEVYAAMVIARRQNAAFVAKIHHVLSAQPKRAGLFDKLFLWSERKTARWLRERADLVFCGTQIVANDFAALQRGLGMEPQPTQVVGYGIEVDALKPQPWAEKQFDAVVLGRMHEHKGVFDLPEIWAAVVKERPEAKLLVIGEGPHRLRTMELFAQRGLNSNVTFTGGIPEAEKNRLLPQARVGITPSYEEGWGLSVNEFLAAALPVVGYHVPVFDTAFPGQLDLTTIGDKAGVAARIVRLLASPAEAEQRGAAGRAFVRRYDYRQIAQAEFDALQHVLTSRERNS